MTDYMMYGFECDMTVYTCKVMTYLHCVLLVDISVLLCVLTLVYLLVFQVVMEPWMCG